MALRDPAQMKLPLIPENVDWVRIIDGEVVFLFPMSGADMFAWDVMGPNFRIFAIARCVCWWEQRLDALIKLDESGFDVERSMKVSIERGKARSQLKRWKKLYRQVEPIGVLPI